MRHPWRGNCAAANVLERAAILVDGGVVRVEHLPADVQGSVAGSLGLKESVERFEDAHIALVLRLCGGNRQQAAEMLGVSPATLFRRLSRA